MDLKELNAIIDNVEQEVNKSARGNDEKHILGLAVRGIWEIARQIALVKANPDVYDSIAAAIGCSRAEAKRLLLKTGYGEVAK